MVYGYRIKKEDFIPLVGLFKHHKRCVSEMVRNKLVGNDKYTVNAWARDCLLAIYNMAVVAGTIGVVAGLESLISK